MQDIMILFKINYVSLKKINDNQINVNSFETKTFFQYIMLSIKVITEKQLIDFFKL